MLTGSLSGGQKKLKVIAIGFDNINATFVVRGIVYEDRSGCREAEDGKKGHA
jgi:hypothetical protein